MKFEWDEAKREANIRKHGIDFVRAKTIFGKNLVTYADTRLDYVEDRFVSLGLLNGIVIVVVYAEPNDNTVRLISARKANKHEQEAFFSRR